MKLIVDRFEGDFAICERDDNTMVDIERARLPEDVREGDVILIEGDNYIIHNDSKSLREEVIENYIDLWD